MDRVPLLLAGRQVGTLAAETVGLYVQLSAEAALPDRDLWCVWAVGDRGELRLGVLEPRDGHGFLRRRISLRETGPLGQLRRGELRPAGGAAWRPLTGQEQAKLGNCPDARLRETKTGWVLSLPFDRKAPFPLVKLFCLALVEGGGGEQQVVYWFHRDGTPCFPPEKLGR